MNPQENPNPQANFVPQPSPAPQSIPQTGLPPQKPSRNPLRALRSLNPIVWIVLIVAIGAGCFFGGVAYERGRQPKLPAPNGFNSSRGGVGSNNNNRVFGKVTAVSATSITVQDSRTGTKTTLSITSATRVSDNGKASTAASIKTGDQVFITESSSNASQAASILLNPGFGGGQAQQPGGSAGATTGSTKP